MRTAKPRFRRLLKGSVTELADMDGRVRPVNLCDPDGAAFQFGATSFQPLRAQVDMPPWT